MRVRRKGKRGIRIGESEREREYEGRGKVETGKRVVEERGKE